MQNDTVYFGAIVGRVANRIGKARFHLDGKYYQMPNNDGNNMLHGKSLVCISTLNLSYFHGFQSGGYRGFGDVIWNVESHKEDSVTFSYHSYDGEEGKNKILFYQMKNISKS